MPSSTESQSSNFGINVVSYHETVQIDDEKSVPHFIESLSFQVGQWQRTEDVHRRETRYLSIAKGLAIVRPRNHFESTNLSQLSAVVLARLHFSTSRTRTDVYSTYIYSLLVNGCERPRRSVFSQICNFLTPTIPVKFGQGKIKVPERFCDEVAIRQIGRGRGRLNLAYLGISSTFSGMITSTHRVIAYPKFVPECRSRA